MDAHELRIGNMLNAEIGRVVIESILGDRNRVYCNSVEEDYLADYKIEHLSGIPLTKEWLKSKNIYALYEEQAYQYEVFENPYGFWFVIGCEQTFDGRFMRVVKKVKFVHQVQNIYFVLRDKEI